MEVDEVAEVKAAEETVAVGSSKARKKAKRKRKKDSSDEEYEGDDEEEEEEEAAAHGRGAPRGKYTPERRALFKKARQAGRLGQCLVQALLDRAGEGVVGIGLSYMCFECQELGTWDLWLTPARPHSSSADVTLQPLCTRSPTADRLGRAAAQPLLLRAR